MSTKKAELTALPTEEQRFRIVLTSTKVPELEQACRLLTTRSRSLKAKCSGILRMPTKILKIVTRKTPCGEGSKTWDRFEMRIHKRNIEINATAELIRQLTSIVLDPSVNVELVV